MVYIFQLLRLLRYWKNTLSNPNILLIILTGTAGINRRRYLYMYVIIWYKTSITYYIIIRVSTYYNLQIVIMIIIILFQLARLDGLCPALAIESKTDTRANNIQLSILYYTWVPISCYIIIYLSFVHNN